MSEAGIALTSVALGALISFAGTFWVQVWTKRKDSNEWLRKERMRAHTDFLAAVETAQRRAFYVRVGALIHKDLGEEVSEALSRIQILSSTEMFNRAEKLAVAVLALLESSETEVLEEMKRSKKAYLHMLRDAMGIEPGPRGGMEEGHG